MLLRVLYCGRIDVGAPICTLCELLALADMYQNPPGPSFTTPATWISPRRGRVYINLKITKKLLIIKIFKINFKK